MINRGNYKLVQKYLTYRDEIDQVSPKTINLERIWLNHWLNWADSEPFSNAPKIKTKFSDCLVNKKEYSNIYIDKIIKAGKHFFEWLRKHETGYKTSISEAWLDSLKSPRLKVEFKEHETVTIEEMITYVKTPVETLREKRIKAAMAFWFITGIRIGAFVSLPIKAVNLTVGEIYQWPEWGVNTKNQKHATTTFFSVSECPALYEIVKEWHTLVSKNLSPESKWFCHLSPVDGGLLESPPGTATHRDQRARKDLRAWCERYNLPYHSPHKFRHGIATYSLMKSKTVSQLKAISQNLMHSNISITDGIYAMFSLQEMKNSLNGISEEHERNVYSELDEMKTLLVEILAK